MSIIPEEHDDIPLYEGLRVDEQRYTVKGDQWQEVYDFYMKELPANGWKLQHKGSSLDDDDPENDWGGFYSTWVKEGYNWELDVRSMYDQSDKKTEVVFDKHDIHTATVWIDEAPETMCVYEKASDDTCRTIEDRETIQKVVDLINSSLDWNQTTEPHSKNSKLQIGNLGIEVLYKEDEMVYFKSEKGTKAMKPELEFFEYTGLAYERADN
ncbi:hypothetical protein ACSVDE_03165 [Pseudalkalibacillus sp. Hm43]|uniref:hypothetical protein n=1 Tax=Pseudalkalibacillus sp. Hm43 TaxID=3450742 RepID=UPI003F42760A